jgi:hypothetical protein
LYKGVIFNIFWCLLVDLSLIQVVNIDTSPCTSSSNNINIGCLFFSDRLGIKIYQFGTSFPCMIFRFRDQLMVILDGMGVVSTMGKPRTSRKREISRDMSLLITIITPSWSSPVVSPTYETSTISTYSPMP